MLCALLVIFWQFLLSGKSKYARFFRQMRTVIFWSFFLYVSYIGFCLLSVHSYLRWIISTQHHREPSWAFSKITNLYRDDQLRTLLYELKFTYPATLSKRKNENFYELTPLPKYLIFHFFLNLLATICFQSIFHAQIYADIEKIFCIKLVVRLNLKSRDYNNSFFRGVYLH